MADGPTGRAPVPVALVGSTTTGAVVSGIGTVVTCSTGMTTVPGVVTGCVTVPMVMVVGAGQ